MAVIKSRIRKIFRTIGLVSCMCLFPVSPCIGEIYKYVDRNGVVHFTNTPTNPNARRHIHSSWSSRTTSGDSMKSHAAPPPSDRQYLAAMRQSPFDTQIRSASSRHGLDHSLVKAMILVESRFDPLAVSSKGAMGLMQLMPITSRHMGVSDPFDPHQNIDGGVRYLKYLLGRFNNNIVLALAAYNAGPENVVKHGGIPPFNETVNYVRRVLDIYMVHRQ